jgi:adenosine deaminase
MKIKDLKVDELKKVDVDKGAEMSVQYIAKLSKEGVKISIASDDPIQMKVNDYHDLEFSQPQKKLTVG